MSNNKKKLINVFTYGSLMYKEVIGKLIKGSYESERALLKNYERRHVKNVVYPGVVKCEGKEVAGVLYYNVDQQDMVSLDYFESQQYEKDQVKVDTQSGEIVEAIVYRYINESNLQAEEWRIDEFQKTHKSSFADSHLQVKASGGNIQIFEHTYEKDVFQSME